MKKLLTIIGSVLLPVSAASALSFQPIALPYTDTPTDLETKVALSLLTELEVIQGNDDGTFAPNRTLNRAEFVSIAMRLHSELAVSVSATCFPDVAASAWYAMAVCQAKKAGIVQGEDGYFSPERPINYAEAVKVLVELYGLPVQNAQVWYQGYIQAANSANLLTGNVLPGTYITRAQMVRLTASFVAHSSGELSNLRAAQAGSAASSSSSNMSSVGSSVASNMSSSSANSSSSSYTYDSYGTVELADNFVLLGSVSPVLASVNIFSDAQPFQITDISLTLNSAAASVESLLVYDQAGRYLGRATLRSGTTYAVSVRNFNIEVPHRENFAIYARAQMKGYLAGGVSGETVQVSQVFIEGIGGWNNKDQSQSSSDTFPVFQTARSRITVIENADEDRGILVEGTGQLLGMYRFGGEVGDGQADLALTDLVFQIETSGGVSLSNVQLTADGTSETMSCSIVSSTVTCVNIPATFGSMEDRKRVLSLYGDISIPNTSVNQALRLSLNQAGSLNVTGSVAWTDGSTAFTWVQLPSPIVRGTYFE